ncbi:MAG TPA: GntR family transcriptional regulator [Baekduia sp.]|jgi:DNA-binding GntR family transcriptional regulator
MPVPEHRATVERHLLRDTAYSRLCDAIVAGTLMPGEQLHDGELCTWLGLSRTPVRDALSRLEDEGLVETAPQRYTRVTPLRLADARQAFPVLAVLHGLATELAVPLLVAEDLVALNRWNDEFMEHLHARRRDDAFAADDRLHAVFVERSGNPHIAQALERLTPSLHRVERLSALQLPGGRSVAQHQALIARATAGDATGAASAARANWMTLGALAERSLAVASSE